MSKTIYCQKLKKEAQALLRAPIPGDLGARIVQNICQEAWEKWVAHQTMLINEYRLSMADAKARSFLMQEMENFLFGEGSEKPPGFIAKA